MNADMPSVAEEDGQLIVGRTKLQPLLYKGIKHHE